MIKKDQTKKIGRTRFDIIFDIVNVSLMIMLLLIILYPLYFIVIASISDPTYVALGEVVFLPRGFTLDAYKNVLSNNIVWTGYRNSIIYAAFGTLFNLFLTLPAAYVLSKKKLPGRNFLSWYCLVTMYFSGGLIPTYLLVRDIGLLNQPYTLIFLGGVSIFNLIVCRIFFQTSIPSDIYEAAQIDGASQFKQFFKIALPLSAPIIAVMTLFYAITHWNSFFNALIYLSNQNYFPLQLVLRSILIQNQNLTVLISSGRMLDDDFIIDAARRAHMAQAMRYSLIFIASAPMLIIYPFVQRHFVKGVMIGSLKG